MRRTLALSCALVGALFYTSAHANVIRLSIDSLTGSTENTGCAAELLLSFSEVDSDDRVTIEIQNTTEAVIGSRLTAVGLELPRALAAPIGFAPGGTSPYFQQVDFDYAISPGKFNPPDGSYDLMITKSGSFEGDGSPRDAPGAGESQTVVLSFGDTGKTSAELESLFAAVYADGTDPDVIARFKAVGPNGAWSDKVIGRTPEPASLVLLGIGAIGLLRRPKR